MARDRSDDIGQDEPRIPAAAREGVGPSNRVPARSLNLELDDELSEDDVESPLPRMEQREQRVVARRGVIPQKAAGRLKTLAALGAAVAVMGGVALALHHYGVHSWRFRIESSDNIEITGVRNTSRARIMEVAGADIGRNIFFVPLDERKKQLEQIPWVESATVMRLLPNRLAIAVQERTPAAFVQIGSRIGLIDAGGVVMGLPASKLAKYSFPVVRGIAENEPLSSRAAAMKIYGRLIRELDAEGAQYSRDLSEVELADPEDVRVVANGPGGALLVHLGGSDFLARYKLYVAHIAEWRRQFQNLQSVDLRYDGQIIVNPDATPAVSGGSPPAPAKERRKRR